MGTRGSRRSRRCTRGQCRRSSTRICALAGPQGLDRNGRVVYGRIATSGVSSPVLVGERRNVIDVQNASKDYSYSVTASLNRRFTNWFEAHASYTYEQARDIQSLTSSTATSNWRFGRALAGDQYSQNLDRSRFELPHRIVAFGTFTLQHADGCVDDLPRPVGLELRLRVWWQRGLGDLNADGAQGNDLIYIPADVAKDDEIRFSGVSPIAGADNSPAAQEQRIAEQRSALERFITSTDCLTRQRGRIMTRNSCRSPWTNTVNLSLRQALPRFGGSRSRVQLDVFNFLNLLNSDWGQQPLPPPGGGSVPLLTHVGQTCRGADRRERVAGSFHVRSGDREIRSPARGLGVPNAVRRSLRLLSAARARLIPVTRAVHHNFALTASAVDA